MVWLGDVRDGKGVVIGYDILQKGQRGHNTGEIGCENVRRDSARTDQGILRNLYAAVKVSAKRDRKIRDHTEDSRECCTGLTCCQPA